MSKYVSKRDAQDADRDELALKLDELLPQLATAWDGDGTLEIHTVTLTRSKQGDGALAIVKGKVLEDGADIEAVQRWGGQNVVAWGFGEDAVSALASIETLLARGELTLQEDRYAKDEKPVQRPLRGAGGVKRK